MKFKTFTTKLLSVICVFALALSSLNYSLVAYAETSEPEHSETIVTNEYIMLKEMAREYLLLSASNKLKSSEFNEMSDEQIYDILNPKETYTKKVEELQTYSIEQLKNFNYTDSQISAIMNFDGSEDMLVAAATTCNVTVKFTTYQSNATSTYAQLKADFSFNGTNIGYFNDIFAIAWSAPFNSSAISGYVTYRTTDGSGYTRTKYPGPYPSGLYSYGMEFSKNHSESGHNYYVSSGSMTATLYAKTVEKNATGFASYGRTYLNVSPSFSFTGASISFGYGMTMAGSDVCGNP